MSAAVAPLPVAAGKPSATGARKVLPGFNLTLGYTLVYLSLIVLIPLAALVLRSLSLTWDQFIDAISSPRVLASYRLTFGASLIAALVNVVAGLLVAWVLVRYRFPGKRLIDALVDLPFALPTAVAGIALTSLYAPTGWIGQYLEPLGIQVAYTPIGITLALIFIGIPFVVRTVQPVLSDLETELEEAASALGANRLQIVTKVIFPILLPALITGFALAFARGVGEQLENQSLPERWYVVLTPACAVSTREIFSHAELTRNSPSMTMRAFPFPGSRNDSQAVTAALYPPVRAALEWLGQYAEARMTGTGSSVFASCSSEEQATEILSRLPFALPTVLPGCQGFVARGVDTSPLHTALARLEH